MSIRDINELTDVGIASEAVYNATGRSMRRDCYKNNYNWQASVVSPPQPARSRDLFSLMDANNNLEDGVARTTPKFTFRAYIKNQGIPQKCRSPHAFLLDPCDINAAEDPKKARQLIENCILITSPEGYAGVVPQVGDTVNIILRPADEHGTYDLQFGRLESMADSSIRSVRNFLSKRECQSLQKWFEGNPVVAHMVGRKPKPAAPMGKLPPAPDTPEEDLPGPANQTPFLTMVKKGVEGPAAGGMPCTSLAAVWVLNQLGKIPPKSSWTYTVSRDVPANLKDKRGRLIKPTTTWSAQDSVLWSKIQIAPTSYVENGRNTSVWGTTDNLRYIGENLGGTVATFGVGEGSSVVLTPKRWHFFQHWRYGGKNNSRECSKEKRAEMIKKFTKKDSKGKSENVAADFEIGGKAYDKACHYEGEPGYTGASQSVSGHIYLVYWDGGDMIRYIDASTGASKYMTKECKKTNKVPCRPFKDEKKKLSTFLKDLNNKSGGCLTMPIGPGDADPMANGLAAYTVTPAIESVTV